MQRCSRENNKMTLWTDSSGNVWELACWVKESLSSHSFSHRLSLNPPLHTVCFSTLPIAVTLIFQSHHNRTGDGEQISLLWHAHRPKKGCKVAAQNSKNTENWTWIVTNENNPHWNQTISETVSVCSNETEGTNTWPVACGWALFVPPGIQPAN